MSTSEVGITAIAFSGSTAAKTLTGATTIWSDSIDVSFAKNITIYPIYTAGSGTAGNKLNFRVQMSPLNDTEDPTNVHWHKYATYIDTTGTWNEETALFAPIAGTATVALYAGPVSISLVNAKRIRIGIEEAGSGNAGTFQGHVAKNTVN